MKLLVTPEVLKAKAEETSKLTTNIGNAVQDIDERVEKSKGYWIGEGGNAYRKIFSVQREKMIMAIKRIKEHPEDLLQMAGVYMETENAAREIGSSLPNDVIE